MAREASQSGAERSGRTVKAPGAFRTISEVAGEIDVPQHVLRFWETKFNQVRPLKRAGGRRYYRPEDVALLGRIRGLLYEEGYTIKGVQKLLRGGGLKALEHPTLSEAASGETPAPVATAPPATAPPTERKAAAEAPAPAGNDAEAQQLRSELRKLRSELVLLRDMLRAKSKG